MSKFSYDVQKVQTVQNSISNLRSQIESSKSKLSANIMLLSTQVTLLSGSKQDRDFIKKCIKAIKKDMDNVVAIAERISLLDSTLNDINNILNESENDAQFYTDGYIAFDNDSPAFDDVGQYGGDQGSPISYVSRIKDLNQLLKSQRYQDYKSIVQKYFPNMDDSQIKELLSTANSEGCGYVALINSIYSVYKDNPQQFEKDFGIPMYKNGDLNYDDLYLDLYCSKDDANHSGTNPYSRQEIWQNYCSEHGVDAKITTDLNVTPDNFKKISQKGQIFIDVSTNWSLQNAETLETITEDAGHAMCITGVTSDGRYIVSSWGDECYLTLNSNTRYSFSQVSYK
jgi:hypothetical protein